MSGYAKMHKLWIHREYYDKSPTTGQKRLQRYEAIPFRGQITQNTGTRAQSNDQDYRRGSYQLNTFYRGVQKNDKIVDGDDTFVVQFVDRERTRGPMTAQLESLMDDG